MNLNIQSIDNAQVFSLLEKGMKYYDYSYDQHKKPHIERMINLLSLFPINEFKSINKEAVLIAIVWHDVYKATRNFSKNIFPFLFQQLYEGYGSAKIFLKIAKQYNIREETIRLSYEAIKFHPHIERVVPKIFKLLFPKIVDNESLLLRDLDLLESSTSIAMLDDFKDSWYPIFRKHPRYKKYWQNAYVRGFKNISKDFFYFEWSKEYFQSNRKLFLKKAESILNEMK